MANGVGGAREEKQREVTRTADSTDGGGGERGGTELDQNEEMKTARRWRCLEGAGRRPSSRCSGGLIPNAADYSRGMKMHNCEGAACSCRRT